VTETVAFLFADLAGSRRLLAEVGPETYGRVLSDYRRAVEDAAAVEGGRVVDREGDGIFLLLPTAAGAFRAAVAAQRRIAATAWPEGTDLAVRMGIHAGEAHAHEDGYVGIDINRAARIGALAHGGQVLVSETARLLAADTLDDAVRLRDLGEHELEGLDRPERVHEVVAPGLHRGHPPLAPPAVAAPHRHADARSVAVLPFAVVRSADAAGFLAVGLHNDVLTHLAKVPGLTVISRTSVLAYDGAATPIPEIARELNAGTIVEGAVQASGRRIRLTVQLIDGIDGVHRWAESYDRELSTEDLFDIQTELTTQITGSLHTHLAPEGITMTDGPATADLEAYRLAAEGRQHFDQKTEEGFRRAIELFERALAVDPEYVTAWVGLADALALMEDYSFGHHEDLLVRSEEAAQRALALDPDSAAAHASLGLIHNTRQDGPASIREFERAMALQPSYADAHNWHSWVSLLIGRAREGLDSAMRAVELDPRSAEPIVNLSLGYTAIGDPTRGALEAQRAARLSPFTTATFYEGIAHLESGRFEEARRTLAPLAVDAYGQLSVPWAGYGPDALLALALFALGRGDEGRVVVAGIDRADDPFALGLALLGAGRIDEAEGVFGAVDEMSPWPCLALHHYHGAVWDGIAGSDTHRDLLTVAHRSWRLDPPEDR
jgi:TolB-like protein/class 3 adenylate cyclase